MKHFFWTAMIISSIILNCSGPRHLPIDTEPDLHLPGMPGLAGSGDFPEPDGLIGVNPSPQYQEFFLLDSIRVVLDDPYETSGLFEPPLNFIIYALPNGNSIEWTMGKQKDDTDDWHYHIQYLDAQINWLRDNTPERYIIAYLEAPQLSWPAWKADHEDHAQMIHDLFDRLSKLYPQARVMLNSHSGGGSLINGLIETQGAIPTWVKRIGFIDSNYGYNSEIGLKLQSWLDKDAYNRLSVFAYNDSVALYEGKPFVSATGGTWFRSKMMLFDLGEKREFKEKNLYEEITEYRTVDNQVLMLLKENPKREIFHTEQVELNGIIHSILFGTESEDLGYQYFGDHCYDKYIKPDIPAF